MSATSRWILAPEPDAPIAELARDLGLSRLTTRLLAMRLPEPSLEAARTFLRPALKHMHSPWSLPDMTVAAERVMSAIGERQRVIVHGDYDADGVTATAVMLRLLRGLGCDAEPFLPSRMENGYGLSDEFVGHAQDRGAKLVITVDCGTSEAERIAALRSAGIDVIVTDHHEPGGIELPPATALVNPKLAGSEYPFRDLVGAGVAFKLSWAICEKYAGSPRVGEAERRLLLSLLPLAALGTVADVAPLTDENRVLVYHGLRSIDTAWPGLRALVERCRLRSNRPSARDVAFFLAPRINAAGRMGEAELALQLLMSDSPAEAAELAERLDNVNSARKRLCETLQSEAREALLATHDVDTAGAFVVAGKGWHEGVVGIVSNRLVDEFNRPALVITIDPETGAAKGSGRSVPGLNLFAAMERCQGRFRTFGGHEQAAGFSMDASHIDDLRCELDAICRDEIERHRIEPHMLVDAETNLADLTVPLVREIESLAPFGTGNPKPIFLARAVRVVGSPKLLGQSGRHFSFHASQNGTAHRAVVFNDVEPLHSIDSGTRDWDLLYNLQINDYGGRDKVELLIREMRPAQ